MAVNTAPGAGPPPKDIEADELWVRLSAAERPSKIVDFPRYDPVTGKALGEIAMRPLTMAEIIVAKAEATRRARKVISEKFDASERIEGYAQVYEDEATCQILYLACRSPGKTERPVFPTADDVRRKLTTDECGVLIDSYALAQRELGPIPDLMDKEVCEAWIERLAEGGSRVPLALLSSDRRNDLVMYLVSLVRASREDSTSAGSPPGEASSPT